MLLTITTTHHPATDLGYLLHKNPERCQEFPLNFGRAYVFYPEALESRCTAALLLDVDPVAIVRGRPGAQGSGPLEQYVNDRPYVASSFMSVAIAKVYGSALQGRCRQRQDLADTRIPLSARISVLPCRGGEALLRRLFEPMGYRVAAERHPLDPAFPDWGDSSYYTVQLDNAATLKELLSHLYVLIPVLDNYKHYYVGDQEVENLLAKGSGWLFTHPAREEIARRYLKYRTSLARQALARLSEEEGSEKEDEDVHPGQEEESALEIKTRLNEQRTEAVFSEIKRSGARTVLDLGCGDGRLLARLLADKQFADVAGMDVSVRALEIASERLRLDELPLSQKGRIRLLHGSLMYRDKRFGGFDAAAVVEVIEHLDAARLITFERVVFGHARPGTVVLTTPNSEYNRLWENVGPGRMRHQDHRFEWTRMEFEAWARRVADAYGYSCRIVPVGSEDPAAGPPTQMAVLELRKAGVQRCN